MNVLIVTNVYPTKEHPYHGIFVYEQVQAIKRLHPDVNFVVYYINGFGDKWQYMKSILGVAKKINKGNYDLVHIHYGLAGMYHLNPFLKHLPTITTFHGSDIQPKGGNGKLSVFVSRIAAKHSDVAVILNDDMESLVKPYCSKIYMVPCAVNLQTFKPLEKTEVHDKVQIVFPSNHERQVKNYSLFCETLEILKQKYNIDAEERELKNMTRQQIAQLYSNSDLLLMTSKSEGSPQAVKEAMCCNLPCVSTPVGDVKVLLEGVKDSFVSKEHNAEELAQLVAESILHKKNGLLGRDKIIQLQLDEDSVANKIYDLYRSVIGVKNNVKTN
ncbi:glycosyltransferase [Bacteroides eggerthii]|jgi:hypothetical protein|uniref:Group 1 glycosyl transferase n=1 Tax=Bacteroides eggerthii TaxID=28111 RepID=A0A380YM89_9BACE|nr:glycosyltransferase [Bacteroides eggerthii]EEC52946.1 glycosyltransferase, group 1 family protein [Bacteroides eggerthii DSM 20697]QRQ47781.1 glycosyltransferase [Bacteroides eggerthii]UWN86670.1 glycosyltransferase [Bacteroides eggerthii]SUV29050.1 group 1 glycosyl transferase [Bacteroides eggerthii]